MKEEKSIKKNLNKIVIIVLSVLIILDIVAVGIWYYILKNVQEVGNEFIKEKMYAFEVSVITGIKYREIAEGEAVNLIQENNNENKKENKETKKENRDNKKEIEKTKK